MVELQNEATKLERLFEYNIIAKRGAFQVLVHCNPPVSQEPWRTWHSGFCLY